MNTSSKRPYQRGRIIKRVFAWATARGGKEYENVQAARKRALLGRLTGTILEIGPGTGPNLRYYPAGITWIGVEPNPFMHPYLKESIRALGQPPERFRIYPGDPDDARLPADDNSVDAVVGTLVLCSVPDPDASLQEILRVLKPGGRYIFIEHVAAQSGSRLRKIQNWIQPLWSLLGDGCHPNRETWKSLARAGFDRLEIEHYQYPGGGLAGPHITGVGLKHFPGAS